MERLAVAAASGEERLSELLRRAMEMIEPGTEVVLVTTRLVDLADPSQFPGLHADPARRAALRRVRMVNVTEPGLSEYFQVE
jgi:hypothetical protein